MKTYISIMQKFWLTLAIVLPFIITYFVVTDGFDKWGVYYILPIVALFMYLMKRVMIKRMEAHFQFLEKEKKK
jgi:hypothetical protein